jgi:hypothetical protein
MSDAETFLVALFGDPLPDETRIALSQGDDWKRPHWMLDARAAAAEAVRLRRDVYVRATLVPAGLARAKGRGGAADAVALPGLWLDIDVNGSPRRNGAVLEDGAPDRDAALELAHAVLQPTLLVDSGHGLQPWWLLEAPWRFASASHRDLAADLCGAWLVRMRAVADFRLDGVGDLARVLRVPDTVNGKNPAEPRPVRLLDDGGPRYSLDALNAAVDWSSARPRATRPTGSEARDDRVEALLERHGSLRRLVERTGRPPRDGSPSGWDHALACRAAEVGCSDDELAAVIRHARQRHGEDKGERDDYVSRTVAAARERVGPEPSRRTPEDARAQLTRLLKLEQAGRRVESARVSGYGLEARAAIVLDDGYEIRFPRFELVAMPKKLGAELAATVGVKAEFTTLQAHEATALVRRIAARDTEFEERDELRAYLGEMLLAAETIDFEFGDAASKWALWRMIRERDPAAETRSAAGFADKVLIGRDSATGQRFVRCGWAQEFVRRTLGATPTTASVRARLLDAGWRQRGRKGEIKATEPDGNGTLKLPFYVVPAGWEDED